MNFTYTLFALLFFSSFGYTQVIFSNGGSTNNRLAYTIGEPLTNTLGGSNAVVTQGFHQTYLSVVAVEEIDKKIHTSVYPNPSMEYLTVNVQGSTENMFAYIYDIEGGYIHGNDLQKANQIEVKDLAPGSYWIVVKTKNNELISRTKFIKAVSK